MLEEYFQEVGLTLVELPIEFSDDRLIYRGYIKELPIINAEGETRKAMQQKIAGMYQVYREQLLAESAEEEKEKTMNLSMDELLRYYDGETFDGFSLLNEEETDLPGSWYAIAVYMEKEAVTKSLSQPLKSPAVFCRSSRHSTYRTDIF